MKIFSHVHTYGHNATSGADKMLQSILEYLAHRGCSVEVAIDNCPQNYELNGVYVSSNRQLIAERYEGADIIFTHVLYNNPALVIAQRFNKPVVQIANNPEFRVSEGYIIYNSETLKQQLNFNLPSIVVNPPTYLKDWKNDIDHYYEPYITLVNCCSNKGGETLKALAQWMPNYKFLGVQGAYGKQVSGGLPNLIFRPWSEKMNYDDTKILIVPSKKESWSLCAAEAMASGIPVLCADLPGLRENCGAAAIYCNSVADYINGIQLLNDRSLYNTMTFAGRLKVETRDYGTQLNNLYNFITEIMLPKNKIEVTVHEKVVIDPDKVVKEKKEIKPTKEKKELHGSPHK